MQNIDKPNNDIRCGQCGRKLGEGIYTVLSIKCPRCRVLNHLWAPSQSPRASERPTFRKDANGTHHQTPNNQVR